MYRKRDKKAWLNKVKAKHVCFGHMGRDDRGSTLIEVVVSVLIVGIAFVPLMIGLHAALKVNKGTENQLYAENVASNVVEVVKTYGVAGIDALAKEQKKDDDKGIATLFSGWKMREVTDGQYLIENIVSGTDREYSATVEFSTWKDKQNDFSAYPAIEGIDGAKIVSLPTDRKGDVLDHFLAKKNPELSADKLESNLSSWLKREIVFDVVEGSGEDGENFIIYRQVFYKGVKTEIDDIWNFNSEPDPYTLGKVQVGSFKTLPKNLIVTFSALKDAKGKEIKIFEDYVIINKSVAGKVNFYCLCENGTTLANAAYPTLQFKGNDTSGGVPAGSGEDEDGGGGGYTGIYAYANIPAAYSGCIKIDKFGGGSGKGAQSTMKAVTVTVMDKDGTTVEKSTTFIETTKKK